MAPAALPPAATVPEPPVLSDPPVQSVLRALSVLKELNRQRSTTVEELHRRTGLPKPTIMRLLGTLIVAGLVMKGSRGLGYHVTSDVLSLSAGYHGGPLVAEAGRPWAADLTRRLRWPAAIAVLDGARMAISVSTIADSAVSPFHSTVGSHLSLVTRALGRAYIGWCPDTERRILVRMLAASADPEDNPPTLERTIRGIVGSVRQQGYALRDPRVEPRSSDTVAVPILLGGAVAGTIGLSYFRSAVNHRALTEELVPALKEASREITVSMERLQRGAGTAAP
ncbi:DNA-binding transcriptional regulator [Muricoccus aerilatus]|uniref:DNA-binding transcriptional regulator n=1 Tax=Muricoccus aerilatus TaxID=452982 RepID=UPI0009FE9FEA|nr:DNA-binding transcriptional regulator [Roseomonas aerilata]